MCVPIQDFQRPNVWILRPTVWLSRDLMSKVKVMGLLAAHSRDVQGSAFMLPGDETNSLTELT